MKSPAKEVRSLRGVPLVNKKVKKTNAKSADRQLKGNRVTTEKLRNTRSLKLKQRSNQSQEEEPMMSMFSDMGQLEAVSVSGAQRKQYQSYLRSFKDFCLEHDQVWPPEESRTMDMILSDYFDNLFLYGKSLAVGEKVTAAVEFAFIDYKGHLHRAKRALRGWRHLCPPQSRLPLPKPIAYGIAMILAAKGKKNMAVKVSTDFDLYLRPGEGLDILGKHIVPPVSRAGAQYQQFAVIIRDIEEGKPDKTGIYDNTLLLDNPRTKDMLGPELAKLAKISGPSKPIFPFSNEEYRTQFVNAAKVLGVNKVHTYQLRHGGASEDLNSKTRDHLAIRERGRWKTDSSLRRYAKVGKIQKMLRDLDVHKLEFCKRAVMDMPRVMRGVLPAKLPS